MMTGNDSAERVILVDEVGAALGSTLKSSVHHGATPLHFAFSCYLFDNDGRVLLTRRSLAKSTWPGTWTNSFCGHPQPDEPVEHAIHRRAQHELGAQITDLECLLPDFRYRAVDAGGIVENEVCPVYRASLVGSLSPNPSEVCEWTWTTVAAAKSVSAQLPQLVSPWMTLQLTELGDMLTPLPEPQR